MQDFTPDQLISLTKGYRNMARALNAYQNSHWTDLSHEQQLDFNAYQNSLLNRAQDLLTRAVRPAFTNPGTTSDGIEQVMTDAVIWLSQIGNVAVALTVGALAVALAACVARADVRGIQTVLQEMEHRLVPDT